MLRHKFPRPSRELLIILGPGKRIPGLGPYIRTQTQGRACQNMDCQKHDAHHSFKGLLGIRARWPRQTLPTLVRQDGEETWNSRPRFQSPVSLPAIPGSYQGTSGIVERSQAVHGRKANTTWAAEQNETTTRMVKPTDPRAVLDRYVGDVLSRSSGQCGKERV